MRHILFAAAFMAVLASPAFAKIRIAASTHDLASIAATVGGDRVEVTAIARPNTDVHRVEVLPSYMMRVARAQVYLKVGLGLDHWADAIIDGSRNARLVIVDCSHGIDVLDKPNGKIDASMGDVHAGGNPHYWLDPRNGGIVARTVANALSGMDPSNASHYRARAAAFAEEASKAWNDQRALIARSNVHEVLTYHESWVYFARAFGLHIAGSVEPVPGIPPTGRHLASLVATIKARKVPVLIQEPYFSAEAGRFLRRQTGIRVVTQSPSCDLPAAGSYLQHLTQIARTVSGGVEP